FHPHAATRHPAMSRGLGDVYTTQGYALSARPCASPFRKRFGDFQPDREVAVSLLKYCDYFIALRAIKLPDIP
ncbi:hypothetical protein, partial [Leclercia adecarboxylata]|uniref:hypothetical protein n=1 Tax=Leclercia adecarboxylata TaxID=83655 RepID=UPI001C376399